MEPTAHADRGNASRRAGGLCSKCQPPLRPAVEQALAWTARCPFGHKALQALTEAQIFHEVPCLTFHCDRCDTYWEAGRALASSIRRNWDAMTPAQRRAGTIIKRTMQARRHSSQRASRPAALSPTSPPS